jgi:hypothetical protein
MNLSIINDGSDPFDGDLALDKGQLILQEGTEEIRQLTTQYLRTFLGEWFLDTSIGLPYFQEIFEKQLNVNDIDPIFINEILSVPGIIRLLDFDLDLPDVAARRLEVSFEAQVTDDILLFSETIP